MNEKQVGIGAGKALVEGPIRKSVASTFDALNRGVEALDLLGTYEAAQKARVLAATTNIKLLGMTAPIPLAQIYYPTRISTSVKRRLFHQEWRRQDESGPDAAVPNGQTKRQSKPVLWGDDFVESNSKVVVLGGPGAGKTTFLRFLALVHAGNDPNIKTRIKTKRLPFFVHLPSFAKSSASLVDFIAEPIGAITTEYAKDFVKRKMTKGAAILLLDSLDEVATGLRGSVLQRIREIEQSYPAVRVVISCRTADYEEILENFIEVEIGRLSSDAISKIVESWFSADSERARKLLKLIKGDEGIASLTETPLLLSLLCIQFSHDLALPKRRVELYRRCVDTLLRDWDSTRGFRRETAYETMSDDRKERLFEHVAGHFFLERELYEFKREQLLTVAQDFMRKLGCEADCASGVIDEIEKHHGILEQFSKEHYCFSHSSLQDYFVARHVLSRRKELFVVNRGVENENWHPVVEFIVALAEEPGDVLDLIVSKSNLARLSNFPPMARRTKLLMLLYRCMLAEPFVAPVVSQRCFQHIVDSQIRMADIFLRGKVMPLAELGSFGVRHILVHMDRPRPTLGEALQPYRKLTNLILTYPLRQYGQMCLAAADSLLTKPLKPSGMLAEGLLLNLLIPLAGLYPSEVLERLETIAGRTTIRFLKQIVESSKSYIADEILKRR